MALNLNGEGHGKAKGMVKIARFRISLGRAQLSPRPTCWEKIDIALLFVHISQCALASLSSCI